MYFNSMVFPVEGAEERVREAGRTDTAGTRVAQAARVTDGHTEENILKLSFFCKIGDTY